MVGGDANHGTNNKTYYLAINNGSESSALGYQAVDILAIEDDVLNDTVKLIKTDHGFTNYIMVEYSNWSAANSSGGTAKLIKYDPKKEIIYIPIILEGGKVTNRYILYQFTGQYFEHILSQMTPDEKPTR